MSSGGKFARGTGRGQFRPPQNRGLVQLRHGPTLSKKTSLGQGRDTVGSLGAGNGGTPSNAREESFQLLAHPSTTGRPFAMLIRLQPEILEELKQAEADGTQASMKFGTNATGHVIQVGPETFKFISAPEPGDLCDIYEEKQEESGEAVLVEAGSAWRKLSVQRILSATEKDRVKKRTTDAENRQKQRKSILVDPSTQMIIPQAGAADANGRKPLPKLTKEPPPKKRRVTASPIKQRPPTTNTVAPGNRQFASPASPSFDPPGTSVRSVQMNQMSDPHPSKAQARAVSERVAGPSPSLQKEKSKPAVASAALESVVKSGSATNLTDLRNFLIGLMQENPKGVTIKAIEKAVAEGLYGVADKRTLEKVMKSIASFHAPGKYLLNAGVEKGNYLEPGPLSSSGRAQEAVRPTTHEAEPLNGVLEREGVKEKGASPFDKGLSRGVSHHSTKEASPNHNGAQPSDRNNNDPTEQEAAHVTKDPSTGGSESSSSSGSGSGSDSESSSGSGSGTDSGNGSGSGSESESSSSSSGASMDEDVDIMSDDDTEKGKLDVKQKPKGRELKPKEDVRAHETDKLEEEAHGSIADNALPTLDESNDPGPDMRGEQQENVETVFGSDEADGFGEGSGELIREEPSSQGKAAEPENEERKSSVKAQYSKESRDISSFEEPTRDNEALEMQELDILVDKISESNNMDVGSVGGDRGRTSSQQDRHKPLLKSGGPGPGKDNDRRRGDAEYVNRSNLDKKERGVYSSSEGRSGLRNRPSSLEPHSFLPEGSPMDADEHLQNIAKVPAERIPQASSDGRKTASKKANLRETHERAKVPEAVVKVRSPSNAVRGTHGSSNAFEGALKLDDERVDRLSNRGGVETMEAKQKKGKALEERMLDGAKPGEISARQSRDYNVAAPSKGNMHRASRESNYLSAGHDRDSPHVHKSSSKVLKQSRQKGESFDRAGFVVEQAERPLEGMDSTRRGKDEYGKGALKEVESGGRIFNGESSSAMAKEAVRFGESGQSHGRSHVRESYRALTQVAKMSDPPFENGTLESKKWPPPMEDSRSKATSGTTSRLPYKGSLSPDQDDYQPLDRRHLDMPKQSPMKAFEDSRHLAYDSRSAKRRNEETESAEMERSKRRASAGQVKQQQHKDEWFQGGLGKQNHMEKGRFSASDSQEYAGTSKFSSARSDEELEDLYRQQRGSQTWAPSSDLRKDTLKAGDSLDNSKRPTPQSAEEVDGYEFFAEYYKKEPDLRGLINTFQEYKEYCKEYHEKYPIYVQLNEVIEHNKRPSESLRKDLERARCKGDDKKLAHTDAKVRREYALYKKRKRMFHTFRILHEELKAIKTRCKEYAEKVGQC